MQMKLWNNKWILSELTNPEKMQIRRLAVNYTVAGANLLLEDNIFNRVLLGVDCSKIHIKGDVDAIVRKIQPMARAYQYLDIEHMLHCQATLNRNKPGYGKTFESIEYCRLLDLKKILVICPKSVVSQWKEQFCKWWPEVETEGGVGTLKGERKIFITNYEQFTPHRKKGSKVNIPSQVWQKCKQWVWDIIICDESHRIKNKDAKITRAIKELPTLRAMPLTGTPILGKPDDLWSQLNFMGTFYSGANYWKFVERFCEIDNNGFGKKPVGLTPSEGAKKLLGDVLSLITVGGENYRVTAGKNIIDIQLDMADWQRNLYKDILNLALDNLDKQGVTVKNAMDQMIKLQEATTNPSELLRAVVDEGFNKTLAAKALTENPKFVWIKDWLEDNEGEKVVIFSKFAKTVEALSKYLQNAKINCVTYIGEMSGKERLKAKEQFVQPFPRGARVIIGTIGALGTGVDGLQDVCRNVIFLDRDWTPGINEQAESRVDRSGQVGMTNVWRLFMKHSVDEYVEGITTKKASDIEEVFRHVMQDNRS